MKTTQTSQFNDGLGPKKTMFVMVTVVGCIAILWPRVLYPMMFGGTPPQQHKDFRAGVPGHCCEVILDKETFLNASKAPYGPQLFRKNYHFVLDDISMRQERPPHMRPEGIHPAMRERGRAIPSTQTVPIIERARSSRDTPPRIVEGRPGPIPGMRPPMGAGSHQSQPKGSGMGIIMPLYTIGIIIFFCYTIMKLMFKKPQPGDATGTSPSNSTQAKKSTFTENSGKYRGTAPTIGWNEHAAIITAVQGLIDEYDKTFGDKETSSDQKDSNETSNQNGNISNGHAPKQQPESDTETSNVEELNKDEVDASEKLIEKEKEHVKDTQESSKHSTDKKKIEGDKSVTVMGMELTASLQGGLKWNRPTTPEFPHHQHSSHPEQHESVQEEPKSIYLEGALPHESQILVADSETTTEKVTDLDYDIDEDEPPVVLSSKISLSLINVNSGEEDVADEHTPEEEIDVVEDSKRDEIHEEDRHSETEELSDEKNKEVSEEY